MSNSYDFLQKLKEPELGTLYQRILLEANQRLITDKLPNYWDWVQAVWVTARGDPLGFEDRKYLVDIYNDNHPNIVIMKSAQMGISERLISEAVWVCDQKGMVVLFTFPAQSHLADFVQARLDPVLTDSVYFQQRMKESDQYVQKVGLKRIGDGFLYMRGSQNEKQIITIDADMIILDERDRFDQGNVPYIDKRLLASSLKWRREVSTPTFPGNPDRRNNIHGAYLASDQRVWMIRCGSCNHWQELDFFKNIDYRHKWAKCAKCEREIDRLKNGEWVAHRESDVHGYKVNGIYNPKRTVEELIKSSRVSGFSEAQQFYNQVLGVPYEVEGTRLSETELDACRGMFSFPIDPGEIKSGDFFAGADVGNRIYVIISQYISENESRYVWVGSVNSIVGPRDSLEDFMRQYDIRCMVVDARPETRKVKDLASLFPGRVYGAYYPASKFSLKEYYRWDDFKGEVNVDRTISLDYLVSDIKSQKIKIPSNIDFVPEFYDQMTAAARVTERNERTGTDEVRWVEQGADHFFHAANYDRIARLKGSASSVLLDYYKEPSAEVELGGVLDWLRLRGRRVF